MWKVCEEGHTHSSGSTGVCDGKRARYAVLARLQVKVPKGQEQSLALRYP